MQSTEIHKKMNELNVNIMDVAEPDNKTTR